MELKRSLRYILLPLSGLLYIALRIRHALYDRGVLPSVSFEIPVINVGNLNVGGSGKTPMVEYLVRLLLGNKKKVAVLSRGYKRNTEGFVMAGTNALPEEIGDEPFQILEKFKDADFCLAVDADRVQGIQKLTERCRPDVIILDDAFQHRKIKAGLNILLTLFHTPFYEDFLFPAGGLRDITYRARQADIIVVTKTDNTLNRKKQQIKEELKKYTDLVFFSRINYHLPVDQAGKRVGWDFFKNKSVLVITGIARPQPFYEFLTSKNIKFARLSFPDHARYHDERIEAIRQKIRKGAIDAVLTTEKDYYKIKGKIHALYYVPVTVEMEEEASFNQKILDYVNTRKFV